MADPKSATTIPNQNQAPSSSGPPNELHKEDYYDLLKDDEEAIKDDDEDKEDKDEKIESKEDDKKEKKDEEDEIKLADEDEEIEPVITDEDEFVTPVRRQEILKEFPDLFKKFPYLEKAYYRDQKFTEVLSSPEEAEELVEKVKTFDNFRNQLFNGDITSLIKEVKENDESAYTNLVNNYLPALSKIDNNAYLTVLGNMYRIAINNLWQEGQASQNEDLQEAAILLNQHLFSSKQLQHPRPFGNPKEIQQVSEAERRIQEREQQFQKQQFESVYKDLDTRTSNVLKATITQHIDPRSAMTDYVKKSAIDDALSETQTILENDGQFRKYLDGLWKKAFETNFDRGAVNKIRSAYLSKAKTVLPGVIKKVRSEAIRGASRTKQENNDRRGPSDSTTRSSGSQKTRQEEKVKIPKNMRAIDYLMQD